MIARRHVLMVCAPLALAMMLAVADSASAQRRGGGHAGFSGGTTYYDRGATVYRAPGWDSGYRGGWYGGYPAYGWRGNNWNNGWGWGFGLGVGTGVVADRFRSGVWIANDGYYPGYYTYYSGDGYVTDDVYYSAPAMDYSSAYASNLMEDNSSYNDVDSANDQSESRAFVRIRVPDANAKIWIEGEDMKDTGNVRTYRSPPLKDDRNYSYEIRTEWTENGQARKETRKFPVHPGDHVMIAFGAKETRQNRDRASIPAPKPDSKSTERTGEQE